MTSTSSNDLQAKGPLLLPLAIKFTEQGTPGHLCQLIELCKRSNTFKVELGSSLRKRMGERKAKVNEVLSHLHKGVNKWADRVWIRDGEEWKLIEKEGFTREVLVQRVRLGLLDPRTNLTRSDIVNDSSDEDNNCIQDTNDESYSSEDDENESVEHESESEDDQEPPRKKRRIAVSFLRVINDLSQINQVVQQQEKKISRQEKRISLLINEITHLKKRFKDMVQEIHEE